MGASRIRSIAALVVVALVLGVFTLSPVAAHFTTNTRHLGKHAWQQFIKKQTNKLYLKKVAVPGQVLSGSFSARYVPHSPNSFFLVAGSYPVPLRAGTPVPTLVVLDETDSAPGCPGIGRAASGNLCIYAYNTQNLATSFPAGYSGGTPGPHRFGFSLDVFPEDDATPAWIIANWALRVPPPSSTTSSSMDDGAGGPARGSR